MRSDFHPGQRWISESEPELGLGSILRVTERRVTAVFKASGEQREYARADAPLHRVQFQTVDTIRDHHDRQFLVETVTEREGLLYYRSGKHELCETELSETLSFSKPEERLFLGQFDPPEVFDLR